MDSNYAFEISKQWIDRNKIKLVDDEFRAAGLLLVVDDYLNEDCYYVRRTFKDSAACDMWENKIALSKAFDPNSLMSSPFRIAKNRQS